MKNPIDRIAFAEMVLLSSMSMAIALFMIVLQSSSSTKIIDVDIAIIVCISFSCLVVGLILYTQMIVRPIEVFVEEQLIIRWRFKDPLVIPLESIADLIIAPGVPNSLKHRWTGGAMGLKGRWACFGLKYEIALAVRQRYFEKYGQFPPLPTAKKGFIPDLDRL